MARLQFDGGRGPTGLEHVRQAALRHLEGRALSPRCIFAVEMVLEEWLSNVARHGGSTPGGASVTIQLLVLPTEVEIRFEDSAVAFDPLVQPSPERAGSLDDVQPGGLGLPMIRAMTTALRYQRRDGRNILLATVPRTGKPFDS